MDDPRIRLWSPVGEAVARLLGPYAEVVLHDVATDRILAIWQPMSGRGPGDPSLLGELDQLDPSGQGVYGPYPKLLADGRQLSSVSAVLTGADGRPSAVLCVNLDRTPLEQATQLLAGFAAPLVPRPQPLFEQDWTDRVQQVIGAYVREHGRPVERLRREDRLVVLRELDAAGVFTVRRAVPVVATALRVSRSTLYALLGELRGAPHPAEDSELAGAHEGDQE
ncbi:helix-turn-helix transcriptional regulator [Kitasatospora azatica]|uniref:helix-turn-helix transcriptional regulator n=1 Tax=Kitasatospora azatica TaxID=58347 RepID=UPI000691C634|nr:PAS domain-containing protein [Kitasatospora azatica]